MKVHLKTIANILLTSIALSISLGTILRVSGPIYQKNKLNKKINLIERSNNKEAVKINSISLKNRNLKTFNKLEALIIKWQDLINTNKDLEASAFFLSLDNKTFAEINSKSMLAAASSIKVPILILLLESLDTGDISWNEKLILTEDTIGKGSGWLAYQKIGEKFPIYEIASEMIRVSDNTATNLLIKRLGGIDTLNKRFREIGLKDTLIKNYLPDLNGTNLTSTEDLTIALILVDIGQLLSDRSRDTFREIMSKSNTNTLIPSGILRGLGKETDNIDYLLSINGYIVYNKTGDIGTSYADTALIQTPYNSRAFASFIVKGPFNDPRSPELIRDLSAELIPFLEKTQKPTKPN